jgi:hypothetical protein
MSNLRLIATEHDNNDYDIKTIANNLSWVLPTQIINSSPSTPVTWIAYTNIRNLANSCNLNQLVTTQNGNVNGCNLLYDEIGLLNPDSIFNSNTPSSNNIPRVNTPSLNNIPIVNNIPRINTTSDSSQDNTIYIISGIIILFVIVSSGFHHIKHRYNDTDDSDNIDFMSGE